MTTFQTFVLIPCNCGCGVVNKVDVSKYTKRVQRGLRNDYGLRPAPTVDIDWKTHHCPECKQKCKAPNGMGTQAALDIEQFGEIHQYIMKALAAYGKANVDELRLYIDVNFGEKTTANALHSRISDLVAWKIVFAEDLEGVPSKPAGLEYESSNAVVYRLDSFRARIVERDNWQTHRLRAIDGGLSYALDGFTQA